MFHPFHRRELLITYDQSRFNHVRDALTANRIRYQFRIQDRTSPSFSAHSRERFGTFGVNASAQLEYKVYVRTDDFDRANLLL